MERFLRSPAAVISAILFFVWWFAWETFKGWFFDKVLREAVIPYLDAVLHYGPPIGFALLCLYLIVRQQKQDTPKEATFAEKAAVVYPKGAKPVQRIRVIEFYKLAERAGFTLRGGSRTALTLAQDIRQAALEGNLRTWGRNDRDGPLFPIKPDHRRDNRLVWEPSFKFGPPDGRIEGFAEDNADVRTHSDGGYVPGYHDIHLDTEQAKELLRH